MNGVIGFSAGLFIRDNFFDFDKVSGASMAPTINPTVHETGQRDGWEGQEQRLGGFEWGYKTGRCSDFLETA
jgi:hypothetical protein